MTDGTAGTTAGTLASALRTVVSPVGVAAAAVLSPIDRAFRPFAAGFNRLFGDALGEITGLQFLALAVGFGAILTAPLWGMQYSRSLALGCIWAIFAMAWDVQSGYTGYVSFGHSALSGIAGYTVGMLAFNLELVNDVLFIGSPQPVPRIVIPVAVLAALVLGLVVGLVSLRLRGPYFSLVTLVTVLLFMRLIRAFNEYTNGELGINAAIRPFATQEPLLRYYWMAVPMVVIAVVLVVISRSNVGLVLTAIRENESAVAAAGLSSTKFKIWSFVVSSVPMGIGGVMLAYFLGSINRTSFVMIDNSIEMIAIAVIGGMASILGPLFGALGFVFLREEVLKSMFDPEMRYLVLWSLVLVIFLVARDGVFRRLWHWLGAVGGEST